MSPHFALNVEQDEPPEGFTLHHLEAVGSTNDVIARLALEGAPSGTMVLADRQTKGRGRLGRAWQSAPGNLQASILLRVDCPLKNAPQLSLLAGVALGETLARHGPEDLDLALKWPNDVLIGGAKVAGILLETTGDERERLVHVTIGLGMNVVWSPVDVDYPVTSLASAGFGARSPKDWLFIYVSNLAIWLDRWQRDGFAVIRDAWRARSYGLGELIRFRVRSEQIDGRFVDLTEKGALLIERADGTRLEMTAGDVIHGSH
ncbi:MAG: biotin--[acetyl-CoA-carboxylase] ligase [Geminicoccaceae bacterium]